MFEEKFSTICKLLYKLNLFDSVKCNVLPTSVCLHTHVHRRTKSFSSFVVFLEIFSSFVFFFICGRNKCHHSLALPLLSRSCL